MDTFATYTPVHSSQFWLEVDDLFPNSTSRGPVSPGEIEATFDLLFSLIESSFQENFTRPHEVESLVRRICSSSYFKSNTAAAEAVLVEEVIRAKSPDRSLVAITFVLVLGQENHSIFRRFHSERSFAYAMIHRIWAGHYAAQSDQQTEQRDWDPGLLPRNGHVRSTFGSDATVSGRLSIPLGLTGSSTASRKVSMQLRVRAVRLFYQVCKVQKLDSKELKTIDATFINHLFDLVEATRDHEDEEFNYRIILLLIALNEQYMVSSLSDNPSSKSFSGTTSSNGHPRPVNLVLNVLKVRLNASKTFGENLIFILNRTSSRIDDDLCVQLLILKLLYLLFTTKETTFYFYTNDLRVLVDIFIRELSDLPEESESLRHTYLRVLQPLLANTQLCTYPYKRKEIRHLLESQIAHGRVREISATTARLVDRCLKSEWCVTLDEHGHAAVQAIGGGIPHTEAVDVGFTNEGVAVITGASDRTVSDKSVPANIPSLSAGPEASVQFEPFSTAALAGPAHRFIEKYGWPSMPHSAPATPPRRGSSGASETVGNHKGGLSLSWYSSSEAMSPHSDVQAIDRWHSASNGTSSPIHSSHSSQLDQIKPSNEHISSDHVDQQDDDYYPEAHITEDSSVLSALRKLKVSNISREALNRASMDRSLSTPSPTPGARRRPPPPPPAAKRTIAAASR
ncbi:hypothetical protein K437DRAFT_259532 [Tilletiaria anomala UBC 951]|uniref:SPIN90/Ldb17 leucine-rich domain-containing protein n=1 Tax=Tilletiaria anomala (strain ATCC 24038 / CBS 436.72 / UBC 951) TaxID=1037660 RepID=A0A066VCR4_TILAU|nr:uncharacterized protein K437DRAFT_259532 [Tilletiaria anomala UBC 951]KDN38093.1 hypothetical protein K437DRAFT_259532 [Tilletiaria anomala UBC 951]